MRLFDVSNYVPAHYITANILVDHLGNCKISDFGISKRVDQLEAARAHTGMKGTVFWMAPEVVSPPKSGGYDVKVDIWSVGCIVLEMWSGKRPWAGQEAIAVMLKVSSYHNRLSF